VTQPIDDPALLFGRRATVQVGTLLLDAGGGTGMDVEFTVRRGVKVTHSATKPQPNTCDLSIKNLSEDHRKAIEQSTVPGAAKTKVPVVLSAGYRGRQSVLFSGELRAGHSIRTGGTWVTELTTGDGDDALTQTRLSIALSRGSTHEQGIKKILEALGVGEGNLSAGITRLKEQALAAQLFSRGVVLKGGAAELMTHFCRSVGLEWSIQNGALQLTALGQPLNGQAVLVDADHGMLGSPTVDTKGILSVKTLMLPDVAPGVAIDVRAATVSGGFKVLSVETKGDTAGTDWGHAIEAARY
jgi:hypothetical protein